MEILLDFVPVKMAAIEAIMTQPEFWGRPHETVGRYRCGGKRR